MPASDTLVIYYSRTGTTAALATAIAKRMNADVERITDTFKRDGPVGFVRSLYDAVKRRGSTLNPLGVDPTQYRLVLIGTPDWGVSMAAPVRTFLTSYAGRLPRVAFFLTDGTSDHAAVFREMGTLVGAEPIASVGIPHDDVVANRYDAQVTTFVSAIEKARVLEAPASATR